MYRAKLAEEFLEFVLQGTFEARQQLDGDDNRDKPMLMMISFFLHPVMNF